MFLEPEVERQLDKVGRAESKSETREGIFEEALVKWDLLDPKFGDTISRAWVCKALGITDPDAANSVESYKEFLFNFTTLFYNGTGLRNHILKNRQRYLKTLHGEKSFEVLDPKKQTGFAQKKRHKDILKSLKEEALILTNLDVSFLDVTERAKNADALARSSQLSEMLGRKHYGF